MSTAQTPIRRQLNWLTPVLLACWGCSGEVGQSEQMPTGSLAANGNTVVGTSPTGATGASTTADGVTATGVNPGGPTSGEMAPGDVAAGTAADGTMPAVAADGAVASDPAVDAALAAVPSGAEPGGTRVIPTMELDGGRVVLRRLNRAEYDNTVRDLLGTMTTPAASSFPPDDVEDGFDTIGNRLVFSLLLAEQVEGTAGKLVDELLARPAGDAWRTRILVCEPTAANATTCYGQILEPFMSNAYRRPVTAEEVQERVSLATSVQQSSGDAISGLHAALKSVLLSPHFLYRVELGDPTSEAATPVSDYELASRMSYFLWASMPDQQLMDAAAAQQLTPAGADLTAQIERMLADPKAEGLIENYVGQWLSTRDAAAFAPDTAVFPDFDDELRVSMAEETQLFFKALLDEDQPLTALVLGKFSLVNGRLAQHYGLPAGPAEFTRVGLENSPRIGVLTQESFLTFTSYPFRTSPVRRADFVLDRLLCDPPPIAPPMVPALENPEPDSAVTLREAFEQHRKDPACASCHRIMDPIGFALENFDAVGAYRTMDNGAPVDATGQLADGTPLAGVDDLAQAVAADADFAICMAQQMLTYSVGRTFSEPEAKAYAAGVGVQAKDGTWPELVQAVVKSQAFLTRRGEAL